MKSCWKLVVIALAVVVCDSHETSATSVFVGPDPVETLTIGRAARDVALEESRWRRLVARLNRGDSARKYPAVDLSISTSTAGLLWDFWDQRVHVFIGDPFDAASLIREAAVEPLFVIEEIEPSTQRAVIVVRESDDAADWSDLGGRRLAFSRHGSDLVHLLPHSAMLRRGLKVVEMPDDVEVPKDRVAVFHSHDDHSALMWLYRSTAGAKAAAVSMHDFQKVEQKRPELFRPVLTSSPIPIAIAVASADVKPATRLALVDRLRNESYALFSALGIARHIRARLHPATSANPTILDLMERLTLIEAAAATDR